MNNYNLNFSLDYREALVAIERNKHLPPHVVAGDYKAFVVGAYATKNTNGGHNLVLELSIHDPEGPYHRWILKKYMDLGTNEDMLKVYKIPLEEQTKKEKEKEIEMGTETEDSELVAAPDSDMESVLIKYDLTSFIGRLVQIYVSNKLQNKQMKSYITDMFFVEWNQPAPLIEAADLLYEFFSPTKRGIFKGEISVDYYSRASSVWGIGIDGQPASKKYHLASKEWIKMHLLGHCKIKLQPSSKVITAFNYDGRWNYKEIFPNSVAYTAGQETYVIERDASTKGATEKTKPMGIQSPCNLSGGISIPWFEYKVENGGFITNEDSSTMEKQISYLRGILQ